MGGRLRLFIVGRGAIATALAEIVVRRGLPVDIVGWGMRHGSTVGRSAGPPCIADPADVASLKPDLVVEAAGAAAIADWGRAAFVAGADFAPVSVSAFVDDDLYRALSAAAGIAGRRLLIPTGAVGGIDVLRNAAVFGISAVNHTIVKPPAAWRGTGAEAIVDLDVLESPLEFFSGSARHVARTYPQNANSVVVTSLAGIGLDRTEVKLVADPSAKRNTHRISANGAFGRFEILLENLALEANPRTSALTVASLATIIEEAAVHSSAR